MKFAWPGLASFRRRLLFRSVFLLLGVAVIGLTIMLLQVEKQRGYQNYQEGFGKTQAQIVARLNHPAGQLALINAARSDGPVTPLRPYVLPYAALDFDDANKVQQAVETAGCLVQYKDYNAGCAAIGNNPWAGGFIYLAGRFASGPLASRTQGERNLEGVHRVRVTVTLRGQTERWIAPFERMEAPPANRMMNDNAATVRGRLTGFVDNSDGVIAPQRSDWLNRCAIFAAGCGNPDFVSMVHECPKLASMPAASVVRFIQFVSPSRYFRKRYFRSPTWFGHRLTSTRFASASK